MEEGRAEQSEAEYFPSKRDSALSLIIWGPGIVAVPLLFVGGPIRATVALIFLVPTYAFVAWFWFGTGYTVETNQLYVKSGPIRRRIPLDEITRVQESRTPYSSVSLSRDRIKIHYGESGIVVISPKDKMRFLTLLGERCPQADIILPGSLL